MLLAIPQFRVDVFNGVREKLGGNALFFVPESVMGELRSIWKGSGRDKRIVELVLKVMEKEGVREMKTVAGNADEALIELSKKGFFVASNDRELRKKIKMLGGKNIYLRQKKLIEIE
jgi:rRNA-processing protein FCF1